MNRVLITRYTAMSSRRSGTVLQGIFKIGRHECRPGIMTFHPDPHFEDELHTETGGEILIVQYPGPTTRGFPNYDDRFNLKQRRDIATERTDL